MKHTHLLVHSSVTFYPARWISCVWHLFSVCADVASMIHATGLSTLVAVYVTACMWSLQLFQVVLRVASDELLLGCLNSVVFWPYLLINDHLLCLHAYYN